MTDMTVPQMQAALDRISAAGPKSEALLSEMAATLADMLEKLERPETDFGMADAITAGLAALQPPQVNLTLPQALPAQISVLPTEPGQQWRIEPEFGSNGKTGSFIVTKL